MSFPDILAFFDFDWAAAQLANGNPGPFLSWTVGSMALGFLAGFLFKRWRSNRTIGKELGKLPGFERVDTLDKLIDRAIEYSDRPPRAEYDLMARNAERVLGSGGESVEGIRFRQHVLDSLSAMQGSEAAQAYVLEKVDGSVEDSARYGAALQDLIRYGCITGLTVVQFSGRPKMSVAFDAKGVRVLNGTYPSARERDLADISKLVDERIESAVKALADETRRSRRA